MTEQNRVSYSLDLPYFLETPPSLFGRFKSENKDFCVEEILEPSSDDEGEHVWLKIEKDGENTQYVANELARKTGIRSFDVGFAGLKDRHALTSQWFSLWLPDVNNLPDASFLSGEHYKVVEMIRQTKKIRRGDHLGNRFEIRLRDVNDSVGELTDQALSDIENRLVTIRDKGFPNYFGPQRFGHNGDNILNGLQLPTPKLSGKKRPKKRLNAKQGIYLSALRSWLFNQIVAQHCEQKFPFSTVMAAPLYGMLSRRDEDDFKSLDGDSEQAKAFNVENSLIARYPEIIKPLNDYGLKREMRTMQVLPSQCGWEYEHEVPENIEMSENKKVTNLLVKFSLPVGAYATSMLREIINLI